MYWFRARGYIGHFDALPSTSGVLKCLGQWEEDLYISLMLTLKTLQYPPAQNQYMQEKILGELIQRTARGAGRKGPRQKNVNNRQKVSKIFSTLFDNFHAGQKKSKNVKIILDTFRQFSCGTNFRPLLGGSDNFCANTCGACIRTRANTGNYSTGIIVRTLAKFLMDFISVRIQVVPVFAPAQIQEKNPGELFMYWFRARG